MSESLIDTLFEYIHRRDGGVEFTSKRMPANTSFMAGSTSLVSSAVSVYLKTKSSSQVMLTCVTHSLYWSVEPCFESLGNANPVADRIHSLVLA